MSVTSIARDFVIMPFGKKQGSAAVEIDCDAIFKNLLAPELFIAHRHFQRENFLS
jgi:hypothetical protein